MIEQITNYGISVGMNDVIKKLYEDTLYFNKAINIGTFMGRLLKETVSREVRLVYIDKR